MQKYEKTLAPGSQICGLALCLLLLAASSAGAQATGPDTTRLRIGLEGGAGGEWGTPRGASLGLYGQLGIQFNNLFAIYYQPSLIAHAMSRNEHNPDIFAVFGNLAMADLTFGALQLGVGGGIDVGRFAACQDGDCVEGPRVVNPAIGGRLAFVISVPTVRARLGVPIGFQIHSTFFDDDSRVTSLLLTAGIQRF